MILFSATTGLVEALFLDNGYLTDVRTAAAGAVAARHMAPATVETAGVLGTGVQARLQLEAAHLVRPFTRALVWGRDPDKAAATAADLARTPRHRRARPSPTPPASSPRASSSSPPRPARAPILQADWLHPGLHITAMGSDQAEKNELDPRVLAAADLYVCDRVTQAETLGELRTALAAGLWTRGTPPELGAVVAGATPGRPSPDAITVCDLTGTGAQDTAIATHALAAARAAGVGTLTRT